MIGVASMPWGNLLGPFAAAIGDPRGTLNRLGRGDLIRDRHLLHTEVAALAVVLVAADHMQPAAQVAVTNQARHDATLDTLAALIGELHLRAARHRSTGGTAVADELDAVVTNLRLRHRSIQARQ